MAKSITYFAVPGLPLIDAGDDLAALIVDALKVEQLQLVSGDIVVIAQKVVSKAENRYVELKAVQPSGQAQGLAEQTGKDPRYIEVVLWQLTHGLYLDHLPLYTTVSTPIIQRGAGEDGG